MAREVDARRQHAEQTNTEEAEEKAAALSRGRRNEWRGRASEASDRMPGTHRVRIVSFDESSGAPRVLRSDAAPAELGDWVARAHAHLLAIAPALGLGDAQTPEFLADPRVRSTADGGREVALGQRHLGLPIFEAVRRVRFAADGSVVETRGTSVALPAGLDPEPVLDAAAALGRAARHLAGEGGGADATPSPATTFDDLPERPTLFAAGSFGEGPRARLIWLPLAGSARLTWEVQLAPAAGEAPYRTLVDATHGELLYCRRTTDESPGSIEPEDSETGERARGEGEADVSRKARPNLAIPGRDATGVASTLRVDSEGEPRRIEVAVEIRHAFPGDLRVTLISPSGRRANLRRFGTAGGGDGVTAIWTSDNTLSLADLVGEPATGDWSLEAADYVGADDGRLLSWSLRLQH